MKRIFEDILDDMSARTSDYSGLATDEPMTINDWYDDVMKNYTHIFRIADVYILYDKVQTIDDVVYQLEQLADRHFPHHSEVMIRIDGEHDYEELKNHRNLLFYSGKVYNKPFFHFLIGVDCNTENSVSHFLNFCASIYSIMQQFWDPKSECGVYIERIINNKDIDVELLGTDAYDYKFRRLTRKADDFLYTINAIQRYGICDDKDEIQRQFSEWYKKNAYVYRLLRRENKKRNNAKIKENAVSSGFVTNLNEDFMDDYADKTTVRTSELIGD